MLAQRQPHLGDRGGVGHVHPGRRLLALGDRGARDEAGPGPGAATKCAGELLNQAVTALHSTGQPAAYLAAAVDRCSAVVDDVDGAVSVVVRALGAGPRRRRRERPDTVPAGGVSATVTQ